MGDITSSTFDQKAAFGDSWIEEDTALPNTTTYTSDAFDFGQVQSRLGLEIKASGAVVIADTKILKIELLHDESETGAFTGSETILDYTNSTGSPVTRADGYDFVKFVPSEDIAHWCKIKITTDSDLSAYSINAKKYSIAG